MWLVQKNLDLVRKWLKPQTPEEANTLKQLIKSISNQGEYQYRLWEKANAITFKHPNISIVYPQIDRYLQNTEYLILELLGKLNTSKPMGSPTAAGFDVWNQRLSAIPVV